MSRRFGGDATSRRRVWFNSQKFAPAMKGACGPGVITTCRLVSEDPGPLTPNGTPVDASLKRRDVPDRARSFEALERERCPSEAMTRGVSHHSQASIPRTSPPAAARVRGSCHGAPPLFLIPDAVTRDAQCGRLMLVSCWSRAGLMRGLPWSRATGDHLRTHRGPSIRGSSMTSRGRFPRHASSAPCLAFLRVSPA